jgi:hypothetical protein
MMLSVGASPANTVTVDLDVHAWVWDREAGRQVDVFWNGQRARVLNFAASDQRTTLSVGPDSANDDGLITIEFRPRRVAVRRDFPPASRDPRSLGVALRRIRIRPASEVAAQLVPLSNAAGAAVELKRHTTIGRAEDNDVRLTDRAISRYHAVIWVGAEGAFIDDLNSVNGVFVNGQRSRHARLSDGDRIELGPDCFLYRSAH